MATVQDRLRQSRAPLDKWTTREQLCLASAVSFSGDQNWMSVSRTMKLVCGTGANGIPRPADWYSQKSCAVQYSHLLENVETPKRKKRTSESSGGHGGNESSTIAETPTDLVLRKLTDQRMVELKEQIRQNQDEYAQLYKEIKEVQTGVDSEERLLAIWHEMEKEDEGKRIDEMKWENQMREREQRKQEMQRNWRTISPNTSAVTVTKTTDNPTTVETNKAATTEPNVEDNQRPPLLNIHSDAIAIPQKQQHQQQQQPLQTSPLLSSLLKSPTSNTPQTISTTVVTSSARTSAPTITNLLTGGPIPNAKQPVVIIKNTEVGQLLTRPISGPPNTESILITGGGQNLLSPSQSAPTLSLLLEKAKVANTAEQMSSPVTLDTKIKSDEKTAEGNEISVATVDSNNDEVPMEIEEDLATTLVEADETDPNEEQQLLEVFENIGNIEMEIDTEFLTAMDEESPTDAPDLGNLEAKVETTTNTTIPATTATSTSTPIINTSTATDSKEPLPTAIVEETITTPAVDESNLKTIEIKEDDKVKDKSQEVQILEENVEIKDEPILVEIKTKTIEKEEAVDVDDVVQRDVVEKKVKIDTISSDDSNDNIPLATVASTLDVKERQNADVDNNKADEKSDGQKIYEPIKIEIANNHNVSIDKTENEIISTNNKKISVIENENKPPTTTAAKEEKALEERGSEIKDKITVQNQAGKQDEINDKVEIKIKEESGEKDVDNVTTTTITVDICEDSLTPDAEKSISNFDNTKAIKSVHLAKNEQKKDSKTTAITNEENEKTQAPIMTTTATTAVSLCIPLTAALVRPPAIRKLRERDRSESPMVTDDDEQHAVNAAAALRLRRRGSSTPIMDSVPGSPASVSDRDERELRNASKKSLMQIFIAMQQKHGMNIALLEQSFSETEKNKNGAKYGEVCLRPMDFQAIQQNIESNNIRSALELQRDILLMCQNAVMLYAVGTPQHIAAIQIKQDCRNLNELNILSSSIYESKSSSDKEPKDQHTNREFKSNISTTSSTGNSNSSNNFANTSTSASLNTSSSAKSRSGFRKSQRIT